MQLKMYLKKKTSNRRQILQLQEMVFFCHSWNLDEVAFNLKRIDCLLKTYLHCY